MDEHADIASALLHCLVLVARADRGFLLRPSPDGHYGVVAGSGVDGRSIPPAEYPDVATSVLTEAGKTRALVYRRDDEVAEMQSRSATRLGIRSVLCIPFFPPGAEGPAGGFLYLDRATASAPLSNEDLRVCRIVGTLAGDVLIRQLRSEAESLRIADALRRVGPLIGESPVFLAALDRVRKLADSDVAVHIVGESGTGKESVARLLHEGSQRARKPYIVVDCAALPAGVIETELFGHTRGSFTGAVDAKPGLLEIGAGGTTFFDEVAELPPEVQAKLLRYLQTGEVRRVGATEARNLPSRIVSATNASLSDRVAKGQFREDLYYRLCGVTLEVPPLRDRGNDAVLIARSFLARLVRELARGPINLSPSAEKAIRACPWPGNIRELEQRIRGAVAICDGSVIQAADLELKPESSNSAGGLEGEVDVLLRKRIEETLAHEGGNVARTARALRLDRSKLIRLMRRLGIQPGPSTR